MKETGPGKAELWFIFPARAGLALQLPPCAGAGVLGIEWQVCMDSHHAQSA